MFAGLATHPRIVVTGPQRSGTTIAANMIAADTGHRLVDETDFGVWDTDQFDAFLEADRVVVQCPTMLRRIVDNPRPDVLVVLMRRPLDEIRRSRDRIDWWPHEAGMRSVYGQTAGDSAELAYAYWDEHEPPNHLELAHADLAAHPMWVPADRRARFTPKQIA